MAQEKMGNTEKKSWKQIALDYVIMTAASTVYAVGIAFFLSPNSLAPGGVTGIAIILNAISGLETGTLMWLINIPLILLGMWKFGWRFILSTLYCTTISSLFTNILEPYGPLTRDPFLAALAGSTLMAVGMGWIFKAGATTGGTDIIVKVIRLKVPHLKTGSLFMMTDTAIVAASAFVFKDVEKAMYAGLTVFLVSTILDLVLYGRDGAKLIYIISDHADAITDRLLTQLDVGVTHIQGRGCYSGKEKNVILCAVKKTVLPKAEAIVKEEDPLAFLIITSATEIYGEGYKSYFSEKL